MIFNEGIFTREGRNIRKSRKRNLMNPAHKRGTVGTVVAYYRELLNYVQLSFRLGLGIYTDPDVMLLMLCFFFSSFSFFFLCF